MKKLFSLFLAILVFCAVPLSVSGYGQMVGKNGRRSSLPINTDQFLRSTKDLQGSFDVQLFSGAASYTYPIKIPKGRLGMTPNINLSYSSNNRRYDSLIGFGWDLSLNSIYRNTVKGSEKLYSQNDFSVMIHGQSHDLVLVDGATNAYQAEIESNFSTYRFDVSGNSWEITDTSGNTYTFGMTAGSRQDDPDDSSRVYRWMLEKVQDVHGNFMTYTYFKDAGQVYPDTIRYSGSGSDQGLYEVRFIRDSGNKYSSYARGFKVTNNYVISDIELYEYSSGSPVFVYEYEITHNDSLLPALMFPESFQLKTATESLPKTEFKYYDGTEIFPGKKRGFLHTITEPLGGKTTLRYKPSTAYRTTWGVTGMRNSIPFVMHTLHERTTQANTFSPEHTTTYEYENGHYYYDNLDAYKKEYAGFGNVTIEHPDGNTEELFFHQSEFSDDNSSVGELSDHISKKGRIYRTETKDGLGNLYSVNIKHWGKTLLTDDDPDKERFFVSLDRDVQIDYDGNASVRATASEFTYDSYGNKTLQKDFGEVSIASTDGSFTDIGTDYTETATEYVHNTAPSLHVFPKQITKTDSGGTVLGREKYWYDGLPWSTINQGLRTKTESQENLGGDVIITQKTYNGFGLPITDTNARGYTTTVSYDSYNLYPETVTNPKGHIVSKTYDYRFGTETITTDPNGAVTENIFDDFGRSIQTKMTDPSNVGTLLVHSETTYDMTSLPRKISQEFFTHNGGIKKNNVSYLNGFGETIQTYVQVDQLGSNTFIQSGKIYDSRGRVEKEIFPVFSSSDSFVVPVLSELGKAYTYDPLGRPLTITTPKGTTTNTYDQWKTTTVDGNGNEKTYETDSRKNLITVTENLGGTSYDSVYSYDLNNNLIKTVDPLGNEREMTYDLLGRRLSKEKLHASGTTPLSWNFEYDENGNIITETEPDSTFITRTYDELDRPLTENDSATGGVQNTYVYDTALNGIGKPTSIDSIGSDTEYQYDILGRTLTEISTIDGNLYTTSTIYDFQGNPITITNPNGLVTAYTYNTSGLLNSITYDGNAVINGLEYSPTLAPSKIIYQNGAVTDNVYDISQDYFLTSKKTTVGTDDWQDLAYTYDSVGNITTIVDASDTDAAKTTNYTYDDLYRLKNTTVTGSANSSDYVRDYTYDITGNILTKSDQVGAYTYGGSHPHAVTAIGGQSFTYDLNGNQSGNGTWTHSWNWQNRINQSTDGTDTISYKYDHAGTRKLKNDITNSKKTIYVNKYFDKEISQEKTYIYAGNKKVATSSSDDGLIFHHEDHLTGSSVDTDISGNINQLQDYYPFGDSRIDDQIGGYDNDYSFTGKERDESTGLMYYDARYYNSSLGRFISLDAWEGDLSNPQTLNKYSYTINNPVKYVDPSGENPVLAAGLAIGAAYFAHQAGMTPGQILDASPVLTGDINDIAVAAGAKNHLFSGQPVTSEDRVNAGFAATVPGLTIGLTKAIGSTFSKVDNVLNGIQKSGIDFIVTPKGKAIPTSQSVMKAGFDNAGFSSFSTKSPGVGYNLPDGNKVRMMEPSGNAGRRASFTNGNGQPITPDGTPPQIQGGDRQTRVQESRNQTHVEQSE